MGRRKDKEVKAQKQRISLRADVGRLCPITLTESAMDDTGECCDTRKLQALAKDSSNIDIDSVIEKLFTPQSVTSSIDTLKKTVVGLIVMYVASRSENTKNIHKLDTAVKLARNAQSKNSVAVELRTCWGRLKSRECLQTIGGISVDISAELYRWRIKHPHSRATNGALISRLTRSLIARVLYKTDVDFSHSSNGRRYEEFPPMFIDALCGELHVLFDNDFIKETRGQKDADIVSDYIKNCVHDSAKRMLYDSRKPAFRATRLQKAADFRADGRSPSPDSDGSHSDAENGRPHHRERSRGGRMQYGDEGMLDSGSSRRSTSAERRRRNREEEPLIESGGGGRRQQLRHEENVTGGGSSRRSTSAERPRRNREHRFSPTHGKNSGDESVQRGDEEINFDSGGSSRHSLSAERRGQSRSTTAVNSDSDDGLFIPAKKAKEEPDSQDEDLHHSIPPWYRKSSPVNFS